MEFRRVVFRSKNIYIWETTNGAMPRLLRLNPDAAKIELSSEPQDLQPLLSRLQSKSSNLSAALSAWEFSGPSTEERSRSNDQFSTFAPQRSGLKTGWQFDRNIPAI